MIVYIVDNEQLAGLQIDFTHYLSLLNALKPCFSGCKNIGFTRQKMVFGMLKA